jgi:ABC-2 type transport system permease protein
MNKIFLSFVGLLNPILRKTGVDTDQLQQILKVKLMMDDRRPKATFAAKRNTNNNTKVSSPWFISLMTVILGVLIGMVLFINSAPYVGQTLYFIIFMVMMSLTLISDFTNVLIDPRDQFILLPRPVNDRTIAVSRIMHISIYVLRLALLQGIAGMVIIGFIDGPLAVPIFFIQILQATFLSIFTVNIIYLVLMKFVSPQKFKDIISFFQIGFSVLIFGTYYLLPKLINVSVLANVSILSHWWAYTLPPVWITALNELLFHAERTNTITFILAAIGLVMPLIGLWLVAKVLAPGFNRRLAIIATSDGNSNSVANIKKAGKFNLIDKLSNIIAPDPIENAGFNITRKLAARTREFKLKVYPAFAYVPIYFLYFTLKGNGTSTSDSINNMRSGHSYVFLIYLCTFILMAVLSNVSMSSKYKSAWIYYALPIDKPGKILSGMYKAIITLYFLPYCLVITTVSAIIWGPQTINDSILAFLICTVYGMIVAIFTVKGLPFSKPVTVKQGGGRTITSLLMMALIAAIGYGHYYAMRWETVIWIAIIPMLLINWIMFNQYKKQTWDNIELADM